jgi:hypothetical protein
MARTYSSTQTLSSAMFAVEEDEEEAPVHTAENPYCRDLSCSCHTDVAYHGLVTAPSLETPVDDDLLEQAMATLSAR